MTLDADRHSAILLVPNSCHRQIPPSCRPPIFDSTSPELINYRLLSGMAHNNICSPDATLRRCHWSSSPAFSVHVYNP